MVDYLENNFLEFLKDGFGLSWIVRNGWCDYRVHSGGVCSNEPKLPRGQVCFGSDGSTSSKACQGFSSSFCLYFLSNKLHLGCLKQWQAFAEQWSLPVLEDHFLYLLYLLWVDSYCLEAPDGTRLGLAVLKNVGVFPEDKWFWIGAAALLGFVVFLNVIFTLELTFLNPLGKPQSIRPEEKAIYTRNEKYDTEKMPCTIEMKNDFVPHILSSVDGTGFAPKSGMVLPFSPLAMSFDEVNYYVDMPPEMKEQGVTDKRLRLLNGITGAFMPSVLTALMGVSGAGKTTLMDVLAGRKTD